MFASAQPSSRQSTQFFLSFSALFFPPAVVPNKILFGNLVSSNMIIFKWFYPITAILLLIPSCYFSANTLSSFVYGTPCLYMSLTAAYSTVEIFIYGKF
jgi:hypothetical protein